MGRIGRSVAEVAVASLSNGAMLTSVVVTRFVDTRYSTDADAAEVKHARKPKIVNVGCSPVCMGHAAATKEGGDGGQMSRKKCRVSAHSNGM